MKSNLFIFSLVLCAYDVTYQEPLPNTNSQRFICMFSSKSFVTLPLTFRSVIHFALCLHMVWGRGPTSFFSGYPLVPLLCVAKTVLPPIKWCTLKVRVYFWTLHPNWLIWVSVFMPITHYLDYSNSAVKFEIGKCEPQLCSFCLSPCISALIVEPACQFLQSSQLGFW